MIDQLRKDIDLIDTEIIGLLAKRMWIVKKIWIYKKGKWMQVLQKWRWDEVLISRKEIANKLWLEGRFIEDIWNRIHDYALNLEQ